MRDGKILGVTNCDLALIGANLVDTRRVHIVPGSVCVYARGGRGYDFTEYAGEAFRTAIVTHMKRGVTNFSPTLSSSPFSGIRRAVDVCEGLMAEFDSPVLDLYVEGPYLNRKMAEEQLVSRVKEANVTEYTSLLGSIDCTKHWGASPELPRALNFARYLKSKGIVGTVSHTETEYDGIREACRAGFTHATHFYSAMPGLYKRREYKYERTVESVYPTDGMIVELIADGIHLSSTILKLVYKLKGVKYTCLVADILPYMAAEGRAIDDPRIIIGDDVRKLAGRSALAGSIAAMDRLVRMMAKADIPLVDTIRVVSETLAHIMGIYDRKGSLQKNKDADILILDHDLNVKAV